MDDQAVIERLRSDLRAQADEATPDGLLAAGRRRSHQRQVRRRAGAGIALAAALVVAVGIVAAAPDDQGSIDTGPAATTPVTTTTTPTTITLIPEATSAPVPELPTGPPSQSPEDAARDGIAPVLADLTLAARAEVEASVDVPDGRWVIAAPPLVLFQIFPDSCPLGDPGGVPGIDHICLGGYGEVLLLDADGEVVRAFPMAEVNPSWLYVTDDAVLGGRVGDGGQPYSTLFRIDRATFELEGLVFPEPEGGAPEIGADSMVPTTAGSWRPAPAGADREDVLHSGGSGTAVVSAINGDLHADVPAIEALLAEAWD